MRLIRIGEIPPAPWKNGGGVTREIALCTDEMGMIWRLSLADVAAAGPFSIFPGLARVLTVIEGKGLRLRHAGGVIEALPHMPVRFSGDAPIECDLIDGPVRDFNLIYDPKRAEMNVALLGAGTHIAKGVGLLPLSGACDVENFGAVLTGAFLMFEEGGSRAIHVSDAALLVTKA